MIHDASSSLHLLGSSHQVADLAARERISLPPEAIDDFYLGLEGLPGLHECLILNTCNRTEIYGASGTNFAPESLHDYLSDFRKIEPEFLRRHSYLRSGEKVVKHLFEVASGI
ncbi:MAG TPA: glutamyl-tRNA reductase, partial [Opitutae bacterium]|nr:glutamyl-tRNA reductase [Opitutae bacterium]